MSRINRAILKAATAALFLSAASAFGATGAQALTAAEIAMLSGPDRQAILEAGARKEGTVTWYTSLNIDQAVRPMVAAFEKKYLFIKVNLYVVTGDALLQKMINEARAGKVVASVVESLGINTAAEAAKIVIPFHSPAADAYPPERKDPKGYWVSSRVNYFGPAYNTNLVKKENLPKRWEDLTDPKWNGKLAWSVEIVGAPLLITAMRRYMGEEKALDFFTKLSKLNVASISANQRATVNRVMAGEYAMSLDAFLHHPIISAQKGAPIASHPLDPVTTIFGSVFIPKDAPQPYAGMLLADYILSEEGQKILAKAFYFPAHPNVPPLPILDPVVPKRAGLKENVISPEVFDRENPKSQAIFKKLFLQ